ncbi:AI-2 transport protein TqsA [Anatilimnocola aggregata]|uniref:AI-2 transport protein TqsA n=1 Tax=Anatilimnocola aggregata TaxID=2528021 RepID=A0A517YCV0_9BACT|nr:AI-2E family transporter [Anatilimnocola aggregata]QDU28063.1 AI-2 transport protein TqsA [Anatilimnocola aggregata]
MFASIAVVIGALYLAKGILVPFTLAVLFSFLLSPVCDWLERRKLGRIPAVLVTTTLGFVVLAIVAWMAAIQIANFAPRIPEYRENIEAKLSSVNEFAAAALSKVTSSAEQMGRNLSPSGPARPPQGTDEQPFSVRVLSAPASPWQVFGGMFGTLLEVLGTTGIVIVFVIFFLLRRDDLRDRFIHLAGKSHVTMTTQMLEDAGTRVSRYLVILFSLNVTFGICVGVGLYFIGVPNAVLWGILAGLLRFIPYLGPWIAAVMPIALSMAISTGWVATILTVLLFLLLELFNNNLLEPWLYGKNTGVSPVAVMLAALFWTWLWGPVGLLLATPLTVCVLVVGKHVPQLAFLDILLGNEPVFEPKLHFYQRLLAGDQEEAAELFETYLEHQPLAQVYDTVLIPALAMAETDWQLGELNEGKHKFILQSLQELIHDRDDVQLQLPAAEQISDPSKFSILCLPARNEADEVTSLMLTQVLEKTGCRVDSVSVTSLAEEVVVHVDQRKPDVICVSATPPAAVMHARHLCKRLRARFPKVQLIVGLWHSQADLAKARERIGCGAIVASALAEAQEQVRLLIQPHKANSPQLVNANDKPL